MKEKLFGGSGSPLKPEISMNNFVSQSVIDMELGLKKTKTKSFSVPLNLLEMDPLLMEKCWNNDPFKRLSVSEIKQQFGK
ncbi:16197_t:CDS:2 [Acaulospora colombiana]|uniref:16197_t:CDS:1 n=1 Tax=Acaulospora colombiana TaxID=27376 RepID=A0ACA9MCF1_9GLOM|nr:16197_t:CDS:2 [Acaulospora colombiana]